MKATLLLVAAVGLAVPSRSLEVKVVGDENEGIFTKIIKDDPRSTSSNAAPYSSDAEPTFYDAQGRQSNRRHQTQRGSYLEQPNRYQNQFSSGNQFNFGKNNFQPQGNRLTSGFSSHQVKYDNLGNPIRQQFGIQNQLNQPSGGRFSGNQFTGQPFGAQQQDVQFGNTFKQNQIAPRLQSGQPFGNTFSPTNQQFSFPLNQAAGVQGSTSFIGQQQPHALSGSRFQHQQTGLAPQLGAGSSITQLPSGQFGQSQPSQFAGPTANQFAQPSQFGQPSQFAQQSQFAPPFGQQQPNQFGSTPTGQIAQLNQFPQTFSPFGQQASNQLTQSPFGALNSGPVRQVSQFNQRGSQFGNQPLGFQQGSPSFGNQFNGQQQTNFQGTGIPLSGSSIPGQQQAAPFGSVQQPNNFAG